MGEGGEDYTACRVCTRACQSSHGKDKAAAVPKFHKTVPDTATHSGRNPLLRCPATFAREHLGDDRGQVILEGASGCEWMVSMYLGGFYGGWKSFAVDHRLEKGDSLMFSLVGGRRFTVFVFDKYGIEKVGSISSGRQRTESNRKRKEGLDEGNDSAIKKKRKVGATSLLNVSSLIHQAECELEEPSKANDTDHATPTNEDLRGQVRSRHGRKCSRRCKEQIEDEDDDCDLERNCVQPGSQGLPSNVVTKVSSKSLGKHQGAHIPIHGIKGTETSGTKRAREVPLKAGTVFNEDRKSIDNTGHPVGPCSTNYSQECHPSGPEIIARGRKQHQQPVEQEFQATSSSVSGASSDSGPSSQELISKAVLAEAKRKKLKKHPKASTMLYGVETSSIFKEVFCEIARASCPNENRGAPKIGSGVDRENITKCEVGGAPAENISVDASAGKSRMTPDDVSESQQRDTQEEESQALYGVPTRSETHRKHSTRVAEFVAHSSKSSQEEINNSAGTHCNIDGGNVDLCSGRKETLTSVRRSGRRTRDGDTHKELETNQSEGKVKHLNDNIEMRQENLKVLHQKVENFKASSEQQKGVTHCKQPYPVFSEAMVKEEPGFVDKEEIATRTRTNPSHSCANCGRTATLGVGIVFPQPQQVVVKTEEELLPTVQDAPCVWTDRSLMSSKDGRCSTGRVVTKAQKQKALDAAVAFSSKTKNPSAVVVMRRSFISGNFKCGLPVCAEIFPKAASKIILVDADGYMRSANWRPLCHYMQGPGWRDFVVSHFLEEEDVCVMEVVYRSTSLFKVQVHIFRVPEFSTAQVQGRSVSVNANTLVEPRQTRRTPSKQHNLSNQKRGCDVNKNDEEEGAETVARAYTESAKRSSMNKFVRSDDASDRGVKETNKKQIGNRRGVMPEPVDTARPGTGKPTIKVGRAGMRRAVSQRRSPLISSKRPIPKGFVPVKNANKPKPEQNRVVKSKTEPTKSSTGPKWNSGKLHKVVRLLDRRKGLTGAVFLVELEGMVKQVSKKGKVKQDESGNWWVPYDHFTGDFLGCYIN